MHEFEGRVAVVTGAASGMGKAFAERFAEEGMKVVLADYEKDALDTAVREFTQKEFDVIGVVADVSNPEAVEELAAKAIDRYGKVHILCNNAGVVADSELGRIGFGGGTFIWEHPLSDWQWTFGVNFWGVVHGIHTFLPLMLEHGEPGHIVNTSSIAGLTSGSGLPIYGASKHAVVRISEALDLQLAEKKSALKVSVLCPGGVNTRIASASRNRPDELWEGAERPPQQEIVARDERWENPQSMSPETVAEKVFKAIQDEQFYILTHDEYDGAIRSRMENILDGGIRVSRPFRRTLAFMSLARHYPGQQRHGRQDRLPARQHVRARIAEREAPAHRQQPAQLAGPATEILKLQSTVGNRAVSRLIQRLPWAADVKTQLGGKKRSWRIGHGSTKYTAVLNALDAYQNYITNTKIMPNSVPAQFSHMLTLLTTLETTINTYTGKKSAKANYFLNVLRPGITRERSLIAQTMLSVQVKGIPQSMAGATIANLLLRNVGSTNPKQLQQSQVTGKDKGGTAEVTKFGVDGGTSYFKQNKDELNAIENDVELMKAVREKYGEEEAQEKFNAMQNEQQLGVQLVGIDPESARMAKRDVAMSRLDQLLGGGVIAQTEMAIRHMPDGSTVMGSLMKEGKGEQGSKIMQEDRLSEDDDEKSKMSNDTVNMNDPNLMRLLSRLQLIDLLAFQVDRNPKNYFIDIDKNTGKVLGITGIDNDLGFGTTNLDVKEKTNSQGKVTSTSDPMKRSQNQLPGMSRYVDKTLATAILNIDLAMVRIVMDDLLSPAEIDALIKRFQRVQGELRNVQTKLLEPNEWTDGVRKGLMDEGRSYLSEMVFEQDRKYRPSDPNDPQNSSKFFKDKKAARGKVRD